MAKVHKHQPKIEIDITDAQLTAQGGSYFLAQMASRLNLPSFLRDAMHVKQRRRGCNDEQMLLSLIYNLASGNGALSDLDALRIDTATRTIAGLEQSPASRRMGEYLSRCTPKDVEALQGVAHAISTQLLADACRREIADRGYVPVFIDGSEIEVMGHYYEEAHRGYSGRMQYWLHGVFVGGVWASARLCPGAGDVTAGWREQLEADVRPVLETLHIDTKPQGEDDSRKDDSTTVATNSTVPVWVSTDNAYYRKDCVSYFSERGWDYSISVTNDTYKRPVLRRAKNASASSWEKISACEEATVVHHKPEGWKKEHRYIVIRTEWKGTQHLLFPCYTVICVSRCDLPLQDLIARHRHKQGMENEFKGPLEALDLHHPPCLRFVANQIFYLCGQLAHLLLRAVQYRLLPPKEYRRSIRTLIHYLIRTVARVVRSSRKLRLLFARTTWRLDWIHHAACQLE